MWSNVVRHSWTIKCSLMTTLSVVNWPEWRLLNIANKPPVVGYRVLVMEAPEKYGWATHISSEGYNGLNTDTVIIVWPSGRLEGI